MSDDQGRREPTPLEAGLVSALSACLGHDRIEPDEVDPGDDPDVRALPAAAYRQVGGDRATYLDAPSGGVQSALFLVELFDRGREQLSKDRDTLQRTFAGPPPADPAAGPPDPDSGWPDPVSWPGGVWVYSIEASDPTADADFGTTDAHFHYRFVQLLVTVTYVLVPAED